MHGSKAELTDLAFLGHFSSTTAEIAVSVFSRGSQWNFKHIYYWATAVFSQCEEFCVTNQFRYVRCSQKVLVN